LARTGWRIIVIDDPLKPIDALSETKRSFVNQWYVNTLVSRLDDKLTGAIIIVMQRVHMDDLTGFLLGQSDEWTVLNIPAIAETHETFVLPHGKLHHRRPSEVLSPEREPIELLNRLRTQIGSDLFSAQYQQAPVPPGGAMIKRHWIKRYTELPTDAASLVLVQSWDTAAKGGPDNDWSVCTTWQRRFEQFHLVDVWRGRVDYPGLKAKVQELADLWKAETVFIEETGTAIGLIDELEYKVRGLIGVKPDRDKVTRMSVASAKFEAGQVFFPERAPWLAELEAELFAFPAGKHDDQCDSISQALNAEDPAMIWSMLARSAAH
jgi:predicted phage terminase large subunit-like protein